MLGVVGESGSGKTTLGRTLLGLVEATRGSIRFEGEEIAGRTEAELRPLRRRMQIVFQDPHASLNPAMTIGAPVADPLRFHKLVSGREELRARAVAALERVGLAPAEEFLDKYPADLSGGQKQRAVLARAIILDPDVLVADEPVSMLDMSVRAKILELMLELKDELGLTYVYITHDLATAKFFCDRIAIMYLGQIVEIGPAEEIYAEPRHPYTAALLRAIPEPDPRRACPATCPAARFPTPSCRRSAAPSTRAARARSGLRLGVPRPADDARGALDAARRRTSTSGERAVIGDLDALDAARDRGARAGRRPAAAGRTCRRSSRRSARRGARRPLLDGRRRDQRRARRRPLPLPRAVRARANCRSATRSSAATSTTPRSQARPRRRTARLTMADEPRYVPAAGREALTPLYDTVVRLTMREGIFRLGSPRRWSPGSAPAPASSRSAAAPER